MAKIGFWLIALFGLPVCVAWSQPMPPPTQDSKQIPQLIKQLGSDKYAQREGAMRDLEALGLSALDQLRLATTSEDLETQQRCQELVKRIEDKQNADILLAPTYVQLNFKNTPVLEAIEDLQKQSGYKINIYGVLEPLTKRTVTLQTGKVPFWEAFDRLCEAGGLVEPPPAAPASGNKVHITGFVAAPAPIQVQAAMPQVQGAQGQPVPLPAPAFLPPPVKGGGVPIFPVQAPPMAIAWAANSPAIARNDQPPQLIVVCDGTPQKVPTSYHGDLRIRLMPVTNPQERGIEPRRDGEVLFVLDVTPEPRLRQLSIQGEPLVQKALDDRAQELKWVMEPSPEVVVEDLVRMQNPAGIVFLARGGVDVTFAPQQRPNNAVPLRLKVGAKSPNQIKELVGKVTVNAVTELPEPFIVIDDVMNAIGKPATGSSGGLIELQRFEKEADGKFRIKIRYEPPSKLMATDRNFARGGHGAIAGGVVFRPAGVQSTNESVYYDGPTLPVLLDSNGRALTLEKIPERHGMVTDDGWVQTGLTMIYRAELGVGPPARIVLVGDFAATATVPFRFENVPVK